MIFEAILVRARFIKTLKFKEVYRHEYADLAEVQHCSKGAGNHDTGRRRAWRRCPRRTSRIMAQACFTSGMASEQNPRLPTVVLTSGLNWPEIVVVKRTHPAAIRRLAPRNPSCATSRLQYCLS